MRLEAWAVAYALGDALGAGGAVGWHAFVAVGALGATALLGRRARGFSAGTLLFFALGGLLGARAARPPSLDPALAAAIATDDAHAIEAIVSRGPEETGSGTRLVIDLTRLDGRPARGTVAL